MTRFVYIADTHLGAAPMGYQQQTGYPERLNEILSALDAFLTANGGVDFMLHGGDMIDGTTDDRIRAAVQTFELSVPVYLCLGNHDLTVPDAAERWLELAPRFFVGGAPDYSIATEHCLIHVAPNQWCECPLYWRDRQESHLSAAQIGRLERQVDAAPGLPHILVTHSPVYGLPVAQTGFAAPYHCPPESFTAEITSLVARHPGVKCVLGGHNHLNMRVARGQVEFVTVSALVEAPFEFKLFEVTPHSLEMSTVPLAPLLDFGSSYDAGRQFVQGRAVDRAFSRHLAPVVTRQRQDPGH